MNFYKHYIGDFQRDTGHLSLTERGAYLALIHHYYATEKPLPTDHTSLCRIAGAITRQERDAVKAVMSFFEHVESGLMHTRIEAELQKAGAVSDTNREIALAREAKRRAEKELRNDHGQSTKRAQSVPRTEHEKSTSQTPDTREEQKPSTQQAASQAQQEGRGQPPQAAASPPKSIALDAVTQRATELVLLLRGRGAALQAGDPRVRSWAERGITDIQALQALDLAQQRRHDAADPKPINAGYLDAILQDAGLAATSRSPPGRMSREDARRIAAGTRLSDFRAACAADQQGQTDDSSTIEGTATRLVG